MSYSEYCEIFTSHHTNKLELDDGCDDDDDDDDDYDYDDDDDDDSQ
jgi:hypothetical protein